MWPNGTSSPDVTMVTLDAATVEAADIAVLLVDHDGFDADIVTSGSTVLDCRRALHAGDKRGVPVRSSRI